MISQKSWIENEEFLVVQSCSKWVRNFEMLLGGRFGHGCVQYRKRG